MSKVGRPKGSGEFDTRINFYISDTMKLQLESIAEYFGISLAEFIRKTMERVIKSEYRD